VLAPFHPVPMREATTEKLTTRPPPRRGGREVSSRIDGWSAFQERRWGNSRERPGLNDGRVGETEAGRLLNAVLDLGVNLIDTARGYGLSEERIGRHLAHRRQDFVLSTKVGYGLPGVASSIIGTGSLAHFKQDLAWVEKGPLPLEQVERIRAAFRLHGAGWPGLI